VTERQHQLCLHDVPIGTLHQRDDVVRFTFNEDYWSDPGRGVLGLWFEDHPKESPQSSMQLPAWFSNLLPEGRMRTWIARDRGVSAQREMELLLRVGSDLPGAAVLIEDGGGSTSGAIGDGIVAPRRERTVDGPWKFSLAGVGMKFSMLQKGERLTLPASQSLGDWIVKLPDSVHKDVPRNEYLMMTLAAEVGIDVPSIRLVERDELPDIPDKAWPGTETTAYAISRFDRSSDGRIHIEDLNPDQKYDGSYETVAALIYRGRDTESLREYARRLVFNTLVGNGDAHLKNWSLIYPDKRTAKLSPAYDIVSTGAYAVGTTDETLALKFRSSRRFQDMSLGDFRRLELKLGATNAGLEDVVRETTTSFERAWRNREETGELREVTDWIEERLPARLSKLNP
jgi:serine/threonine-protein kinase HipA